MTDPTDDEIADRLRALLAGPLGALRPPGRGATAERHLRLMDAARTEDVGIARLAEAHVDAIAIAAEAGAPLRDDALYGVWASAGRLDADGATVTGTRPFCSGLGIVDRALVTATGPAGEELLLDLDVHHAGVGTDLDGWGTPALTTTRTGTTTWDGVPYDPQRDVVGPSEWYLARPGFWHGACGPASCWAGAALGLVDAVATDTPDDPHRRAHVGGLRAAAWGLRAVLARAGDEIDDAPDDAVVARARALAVRELVERLVADVLDRVGRGFGPRPFVGDPALALRWADAHLYVRQHHAERDLAVLGAQPADAAVPPTAPPTGEGG